MRTVLVSLASFLTLTGCAQVGEPIPRAWSTAALDDLKRAAEAAPSEGLPAQDATLEEIVRLERRAARNQAAAAQVDAAADALFSDLARSFARGATDPALADPEWLFPSPPEPDLAGLRYALAAGGSPSALLSELLPRSPEYLALRAELARTLAEEPGSLNAQGFDREARLASLRATMERWRWLPRELPTRRVEVRIAQFQVVLHRPETPPAVHAAIVGADQTPTPSFMADITALTLNPSWEPPASILYGELLPRFRDDPGAADREGFDVIGPNGQIIEPTLVDWSREPFSGRLRQRPGPNNALGLVRFDLPNPHSIYLHDTSNRSLFTRADRALSHGCIRVEDPVSLAASVIDAPEWDVAELESALEFGATMTIDVATPTPVYLLYLTASADGNGAVSYFADLYRRDAAIVAALDAAGGTQLAASPVERDGCA